jgi:hypothetical protein
VVLLPPAFAVFSPFFVEDSSERMKWSPLELAVKTNKAKIFHSLLTLHRARDVPIPDIKGLIDRAASSSQTKILETIFILAEDGLATTSHSGMPFH